VKERGRSRAIECVRTARIPPPPPHEVAPSLRVGARVGVACVDANPCNSEVAMCSRIGFEYSRSHKPKKDIFLKARAELAKRLRVLQAPT